MPKLVRRMSAAVVRLSSVMAAAGFRPAFLNLSLIHICREACERYMQHHADCFFDPDLGVETLRVYEVEARCV